jgi:hypothetical protein
MDDYEKFLNDQSSSFDVESLMSDDLKKLDSISPPASLFKYIPAGRPGFFSRPLLRFTQRTGLNDPFELMKRWEEFASKPFRDAFTDQINKTVRALEHNHRALLSAFAKEQGLILEPTQIASVLAALQTPEMLQKIKTIFDNANNDVSPLIENYMAIASQHEFSELTSKLGILSLSENPKSRVMWSVYASAGEGFLIEFDTNHKFFKAPNGRNRLWPVSYRDEIKGSFLENPMALFLTKHTDYSFEKEWRMACTRFG